MLTKKLLENTQKLFLLLSFIDNLFMELQGLFYIFC